MFIAIAFVPLTENLAASPKTCIGSSSIDGGARDDRRRPSSTMDSWHRSGSQALRFFPEERCIIAVRGREARRKMARSRFPLVHHRLSLSPSPSSVRFNGPKDGTVGSHTVQRGQFVTGPGKKRPIKRNSAWTGRIRFCPLPLSLSLSLFPSSRDGFFRGGNAPSRFNIRGRV